MKAIVCTKYGSPEVLKLAEVEKPTPKDHEVLIKVKATTATSGDSRIRQANPFLIRLIFGFKKPRNSILGGNLAGVVESSGKDVTLFKEGDEVFASTGMSFGSYAEYKCLDEDSVLATKPSNLNYKESVAVIFGGLTALYFLKKAGIKRGQKVLVYGASGAVGTAAVQLAKHFGAEVTAVCGASSINLVKSLGATVVIDYRKEDFSKSGQSYDIVYEAVGKTSISKGKKIVKKNGVYIAGASGILKGFSQLLWTSLTSGKKIVTGVAGEAKENLIELKKIIEEGGFKSVIDKTYSLEEIVEAHTYVDTGRKTGSVVITLEDKC
ncbi:MAG: NADPH:quinone reductase-like Zn-dependent oxidoreductase [Candidatus Paceibacteria bacterium]|jgi:NADPH:quinone reductase-like Zn-dependent oxidoreductase